LERDNNGTLPIHIQLQAFGLSPAPVFVTDHFKTSQSGSNQNQPL
jgi:hypothetical protein